MSDTVKAWIEERRAIHREATEDTARVLWEHDDPEGESPNENFESEPKWEQERLKQAAQAMLESSDAHSMFHRALDALNAVNTQIDRMEADANTYGDGGHDLACDALFAYVMTLRQAIEGAINE